MIAALEWTPADGSVVVVPNHKDRSCAHCHGPNDRPGQRYCRRCHTVYMREWRAAQPKPQRPPRRETVVKWNVERGTTAVSE